MKAPPELIEVLNRARAFIEERTIQLYFRADGGNAVPKGTGTLLQLRDAVMIVTAAHVVKLVQDGEGRLGVFNGDERFEHIGGVAAQFIDGTAEDLVVLRLDEESVRAVATRKFAGLLGALNDANLCHQLCSIVGYPVQRTRMKAPGLMEYGSYATCTSVVTEDPSLSNFDSARHLLLSNTDLVDVNGDPVTGPHLEGMSGCGVWSVLDRRRPLADWTEDMIQLVGVETGTYDRGQLIKATRWSSVWRLIFDRWRDLRPRMNRISIDADGNGRIDFS